MTRFRRFAFFMDLYLLNSGNEHRALYRFWSSDSAICTAVGSASHETYTLDNDGSLLTCIGPRFVGLKLEHKERVPSCFDMTQCFRNL